jgi:hypothetical protein
LRFGRKERNCRVDACLLRSCSEELFVSEKRFGGIKPSENEWEQGGPEDVIKEAACDVTLRTLVDCEGLDAFGCHHLDGERILGDEMGWPTVPIRGDEEASGGSHVKAAGGGVGGSAEGRGNDGWRAPPINLHGGFIEIVAVLGKVAIPSEKGKEKAEEGKKVGAGGSSQSSYIEGMGTTKLEQRMAAYEALCP